MSNGDVFALFIGPLLDAFPNDEGVKLVRAQQKSGRRLEDAMLDAIEALPQRQTVRLRGWVAQSHDYRAWLEMEPLGWQMSGRPFNEHQGKRVFVNAPKKLGNTYAKRQQAGRDAEKPIAAAIGARSVKRLGETPLVGFYYEVTRAW